LGRGIARTFADAGARVIAKPPLPRLVTLNRAQRRVPLSPPEEAITIRSAFPDDALALGRLATLDSRPLPAQPILLAEVDGQLRAALSVVDGAVIADPFHRSAPLVELLAARAFQLPAASAKRPRRRPTARTQATYARRHADDGPAPAH
jgi:hypothetical protein